MLSLFKRKKALDVPALSEVSHARVMETLSRLEIKTKRRLASLLPGPRRSLFRGAGLQFREFRNYLPGDDVRHIHWGVTARTSKPMVRVYEEERELNIMLVVDTSGSSLSGFPGKRRIHLFTELAMAVGLAGIQQGDHVGLISADGHEPWFLPARRSEAHWIAGLARLLETPRTGTKSDLAGTLTFLRRALKHPSLILILSDFLVPPFESELSFLTRKHEAVLIHAIDSVQSAGASHKVLEVCDPETGKFFLLDGKSTHVQKALSGAMENHAMHTQECAQRNRSGYFQINPQEDALERLVHYFGGRRVSRVG